MANKFREMDVSRPLYPPIEVAEKKFNTPQDLGSIEEPLEIAAEPPVEASAVPDLVRRVGVFPNLLLGTWLNVNPSTRGLVKLSFKLVGPRLFTVHAYGACHPIPCDWGSQAGVAYADGVNATQPVAFSATFPASFKTTIVTGHFEGKLLVVETFDRFTDGSGRSDYYAREVFRRA